MTESTTPKNIVSMTTGGITGLRAKANTLEETKANTRTYTDKVYTLMMTEIIDISTRLGQMEALVVMVDLGEMVVMEGTVGSVVMVDMAEMVDMVASETAVEMGEAMAKGGEEGMGLATEMTMEIKMIGMVMAMALKMDHTNRTK